MKYIVLSDIHGSLKTFIELLEIAKKEKIKKFVLLGDVLYHGPRNPLPEGYNPKELAAHMNDLKLDIVAVRGNCDAEVDQMVLDYEILTNDRIVKINDKNMAMSHGHHKNEDDLPIGDYDIFAYGHTHLPVLKKENNLIILNPGSLTLPKQNNPKSFAVIDDDGIEIRKLEDNSVIKSLVFRQ